MTDNSIKRLRHENRFVQVSNDTVRDWNLSLKARGLLVVAMSLPDDWNLTVEWLGKQGPDGRDSVRSAMAELEQFGYSKYVRLHRGGYWIIRESLAIQWVDFSTTENPESKVSTTDFPMSEIPQPYKERSDKDHNTGVDLLGTPSSTESKTAEIEQAFLKFWSAYPKKVGKPVTQKAFRKHAKFIDEILAGIETHKKTDQWRKSAGQFIPNPTTFLNQERWRDTPLAGAAPATGNAGTANKKAAYQY